MKKQIIALAILGMFMFSLVGVLAQLNMYQTSDRYTRTEMEQIQNNFQNKYQFNCTGNCTYYMGEKFDNLQLEVKTQKKLFGFIPVTAKENYIFDSEGSGEIIQARYNIWSRLLNQERIQW